MLIQTLENSSSKGLKTVAAVTNHAFEIFLFLAQRGKADLAYAKPLAVSAIKPNFFHRSECNALT